MKRMTVTFFSAKATRNEAARWSYWARRAGFPSVGSWLERLANREVRQREREGGYVAPEQEEEVRP